MNRSVTHILPVLVRGGAELQLVQLATAQRARGAHVTVVYLCASERLVEELQQADVDVRRLGVRALLGARRSDVVHAWMYHGFAIATTIRPFGRAAHVWGVRRTDPDSAGLSRTTRLVIACCRRLGARAADGIVYNAEAARLQHEASGFPAPLSAVVPNAVAEASFEVARHDPPTPTFGCLTRWNPDKGVDVLVDAWSAYRDSGGVGRLLLAGPAIDSDNPDLVELVGRAGVADSVDLVGPLTDVGEFYGGLSAYVSPSRSEGFPNVVAEAMAAGLPVIATDVGGTAEVVSEAGVLVPSDDAAAIATAMRSLVAPTADRTALGDLAREHVRREFGTGRMLAATDQVYERALERRRAARARRHRPAR